MAAKDSGGSRRRLWRSLLAIVATLAVTAAFYRLPAANETTVGFLYLLVVLAVASVFGLPEALAASFAAAAQYNFFFLPPVGTFTIDDARNWVALAAFLTTAVIAGELSAAAKRRANEAERHRLEVARLYELSRASLLADPAQTEEQVERALVGIFGVADVFIETADRPVDDPGLYQQHWPLHLGQRQLGVLHVQAAALGGGMVEGGAADAIAGVVAIALERARLLREGARIQALRESEGLKSALLGSVTHDLRTPLTAIKAAVTTLLAGGADETAGRDLLDVIDEESDALDRLLENMLDLARIEAGALRPTLVAQALGPVIEQAILQARLPATRVTVALAADLPLVRGDGFLLSRALFQLLANAAAYADAQAAIEVSAWADGSRMRVTVEDHGRGIAPADMPRIFQAFFRDPQAQRVRPDGLGMGLAIAHGIVAAHGGELRASSELNRGSRFWFTLPLDTDGKPHSDR